MRNTLTIGDTREWAKSLPPKSIQTIVTSPPYFGLRSYLAPDHPDKGAEMGSETSPREYVAALVALFGDLRTALRDDGVAWINLGDSFNGTTTRTNDGFNERWGNAAGARKQEQGRDTAARNAPGLGPKQLLGIPWRVAFGLQDDGWYLRSDIIWSKSNPMPESVTDRPTRAHEYVFLLSKGPRYFYDAAAIQEPFTLQPGDNRPPGMQGGKFSKTYREAQLLAQNGSENIERTAGASGRNKRTVWTIPTVGFPSAHFATFPPDLIRPCIRAGSSERGACAACGAPWKRQMERTGETPRERAKRVGFVGYTNAYAGDDGARQGLHHAGHRGEVGSLATTGWQPSCRCGTTETRPCLIADPFAGSGTTGQVCVEEGRDYVLCDLDERARGWLASRLAPLPVARLAGL